jgi:hypothetical protein
VACPEIIDSFKTDCLIEKSSVLLPAFAINKKTLFAKNKINFRRVRPGDALWPTEDKWQQLSWAVNGNL